ncbi:MAG: RDD family protein [Acidobacteriaceae bacterium]|nr:RDD family protein [Acidobacteriaceae bacterium]
MSSERARATPEPAPKMGQQSLFPSSASPQRVISFDTLTTKAEREAIRARAVELARPVPVKTGKVELRHARGTKTRPTDQRGFDFLGKEAVPTQPQSNIICDAPVAPSALRIEAAIIDLLFMAVGSAFGLVMFRYEGGQFSFDKHTAPFFLLAILTVPLFYKMLWTFAGRDTIGMRWAGVRLVDFDGNPPSHQRRYQRFLGSILSLLAAGIGLVWALVDEDGLTWHDHISTTFPTLTSED